MGTMRDSQLRLIQIANEIKNIKIMLGNEDDLRPGVRKRLEGHLDILQSEYDEIMSDLFGKN